MHQTLKSVEPMVDAPFEHALCTDTLEYMFDTAGQQHECAASGVDMLEAAAVLYC